MLQPLRCQIYFLSCQVLMLFCFSLVWSSPAARCCHLHFGDWLFVIESVPVLGLFPALHLAVSFCWPWTYLSLDHSPGLPSCITASLDCLPVADFCLFLDCVYSYFPWRGSSAAQLNIVSFYFAFCPNKYFELICSWVLFFHPALTETPKTH